VGGVEFRDGELGVEREPGCPSARWSCGSLQAVSRHSDGLRGRRPPVRALRGNAWDPRTRTVGREPGRGGGVRTPRTRLRSWLRDASGTTGSASRRWRAGWPPSRGSRRSRGAASRTASSTPGWSPPARRDWTRSTTAASTAPAASSDSVVQQLVTHWRNTENVGCKRVTAAVVVEPPTSGVERFTWFRSQPQVWRRQ